MFPSRQIFIRFKILFLLLLFLVSFVHCKQTPKERVNEILSDSHLSHEETARQVANALFGEKLKEVEIIAPKFPETKYEVYLGFGGSSALTFLESKQYAERMKLELAVSSYRFLQSTERVPIGKFRMSLVKPFFIKNGEQRGTEEFEIFRFRTQADQIGALPGFRETDSFRTDRYDEPTEDVKEVLNRIMENWTIELDHFYRIEVK